ncbi:hypothetical protein LXL04_006022 [Taraxacum kok-saghyz]
MSFDFCRSCWKPVDKKRPLVVGWCGNGSEPDTLQKSRLFFAILLFMAKFATIRRGKGDINETIGTLGTNFVINRTQ